MPDPGILVDFADRFPPEVLEGYLALRAGAPGRRLARPARLGLDWHHLVLASDGEQCLGGVRLTVRPPDSEAPLPGEEDFPGLVLREAFPDLPLDEAAHAEVSRLVLASRSRFLMARHAVAHRLLRFAWHECRQAGLRYVFSFASRFQQRLYERVARECRVDVRVHPVAPDLVPHRFRHLAGVTVQAYLLEPLPMSVPDRAGARAER